QRYFGHLCSYWSLHPPEMRKIKMRKILAFLLLSASLAFTQGTHTATISGCTDTTPSATCSFSVTGLMGLTTYFWYTKAVCSTCSPSLSLSGPSNEVTGTTLSDPQPTAPTGLSTGTITKNNVPLQWNAPAVQAGWTPIAFEIVRGTSPTLPGPAIIAELPISQTSFVDKGCLKTCYYAAKAYSIEGLTGGYHLSAMSNIVKAV